MTITVLVLQICVLIEYHQRTFSLQISHEARHTNFRRYTYQHVYVIGHQMPFQNLYSFILTQLLYYIFYAHLVLIVYCFSSILWREHYVVFTHPLCVRQTIGLIGHIITFPFNVLA